jgi:hypothetical protein
MLIRCGGDASRWRWSDAQRLTPKVGTFGMKAGSARHTAKRGRIEQQIGWSIRMFVTATVNGVSNCAVADDECRL